MRRLATLAIAALLVFFGLLIARFPARWAAPWLPSVVTCGQLSGTVWNGRCTGLAVAGTAFGEARWSIRASRLLLGRLSGTVVLAKPGLHFRGVLERGTSQELHARDIHAVVDLAAAAVPQVPRNARGILRAELGRLVIADRAIAGVEGRIEATGLAQAGTGGTYPLGDYELTFPDSAGSAEPTGRLEDLRGPLDVSGTLRLTREPGWVLEGHVAPRPEAPPELIRQLQYLGPPDAAGRRAFSIAGTY